MKNMKSKLTCVMYGFVFIITFSVTDIFGNSSVPIYSAAEIQTNVTILFAILFVVLFFYMTFQKQRNEKNC